MNALLCVWFFSILTDDISGNAVEIKSYEQPGVQPAPVIFK